jgi:uncharacterized integral membrane protein (TIGR00698 family)
VSEANKAKASLWPTAEMTGGLLLCVIIAVVSYLSNKFIYNRISALLWAFIYSIALVNIVPPSAKTLKGANYAASNLLKFSIAVLGLTISALAWVQMGFVGLIEVLVVITFAMLTGLYLGKAMGLSEHLATLIAAGRGIGGATAIAATGPSIDAKEEEMGMAVACVTLFGLIAMFLYPFLFTSTVLGAWLHHSAIAAGVWCGTAIHETAQVVGAASQISEKAMAMALVTKSVRIFSIAPVVIILSAVFHHRRGGEKAGGKLIPFFAICFVVFTLINSALLAIPATKGLWGPFMKTYLSPAVTFLLAVAFAGVGAKVRFKSFAKLGFKAFATGFAVAVLTAVLALLLVIFVYMPASGI